jgi:hypothetical protein
MLGVFRKPDNPKRRYHREYMRVWRSRNPVHAKEYKHAWDQALRKEVLQHYGGKCVCCGENRLAFLALDHKNGGGTKHRQKLGLRGSGMWAWVKREDFPDMFRVLCHNCNQALGYYGYCPHNGGGEVLTP